MSGKNGKLVTFFKLNFMALQIIVEFTTQGYYLFNHIGYTYSIKLATQCNILLVKESESTVINPLQLRSLP